MATTRPTAATIRNVIYTAISEAGAAGIALSQLNKVCTAGRQLTSAEIGAATASLIAAGRVTAETERGRVGRSRTVYRTGSADREAWFQAEVKRRKLVRAITLPVLGRCR